MTAPMQRRMLDTLREYNAEHEASGPKQNLVLHKKILPPAALPTARHVSQADQGKE